jgi:hypothetical protein
MTSRCLDSACVLECYSPPESVDPPDWRNCNSLIDDGCESNVVTDANNCGACGNVCAAGTACIDGKCGCPTGQIACNGSCVDPLTDDYNCGACGNACGTPDDACSPQLPNTHYGCLKGTCDHLLCYGNSADCNGDLQSGDCAADGCEVPDLATDRDNCGACGVTCTGAEECVDEGDGPTCAIPCKKFGQTACAGDCRDLLNDPNNCGSCGAGCGSAGPNQEVTCKKGLCAFDCAAGFADCNGDPLDGCETNLSTHPANCGGCGITCDIAGGQPCIEGKCLMTECEGGVAK